MVHVLSITMRMLKTKRLLCLEGLKIMKSLQLNIKVKIYGRIYL